MSSETFMSIQGHPAVRMNEEWVLSEYVVAYTCSIIADSRG
jgi:hypothetical protein